MELNNEELKEWKRIAVNILQRLHTICKENGLKYFAVGGTAIGAVRHGGIIPWDDDIDINITRKDWNRLLPLLKSRFGDKYDILTPGCDNGYALLFPQIRLAGTLLRTRDDLQNDHCGVPVDIFLIENTYSNPVRRFIHMLGCQYYGFLLR